MLGGASEVESIDFSAYTAGTGNAGTTILSATVRERRHDRFTMGIAPLLGCFSRIVNAALAWSWMFQPYGKRHAGLLPRTAVLVVGVFPTLSTYPPTPLIPPGFKPRAPHFHPGLSLSFPDPLPVGSPPPLQQFLILCEKVLGFKDGNEIFHEPASGFKKVDFGQSIGEKTASRLHRQDT